MIKRINFIALSVLAIAIVTTMSCKKVLNNPDTGTNDGDNIDISTPAGTATDKLYDSIYLYALQTYYWNNQIPTYKSFNPRQYENSNDSLGLANEIYAFTRYPKDANGNLYEQRIKFDPNTAANEPDNSTPKYSQIYYSDNSFVNSASYIQNIQFSNQKAEATLNGKDSSFGFILGFVPASYTYDSTIAVNKDSTVGVIRYVITGSPASKAGLRRGDVILSYNGQALNYDNNLSEIEDLLFNSTQLDLSVYDPYQKDTVNVSLQSKSYTFNPIFKSEVLTYGSHKIAYLAFQTFSDITNAQPALDTAFKSYASQGATDIVVDLRYNGGGYVNTAEALVNYLAPSSANNKTMHSDYYNNTMVNGKATLLANIPQDYDDLSQGYMSKLKFSPADQTTQVQKAGSLDIKNVYFIVSSGTASASELVINCLKPYSTVTQLSADFSDTSSFTYGKPVAFFEIRVGKFSMWIPNFETKNANGGGGYYQGIQSLYNGKPAKDFDDILHDFGDPKEYCLSDAIYLISGVDTYQTTGKSLFANQRALPSIVSKTKSVGNVYRVSNMIGKPKRVLR